MSLPETIVRGPKKRPPRIILLGEPKIGKTTWASQSTNPIFLPIVGEEGVDAIDSDKFPPAQTFADVLSALTAVWMEPHQYKTVVIDSASALEPLVWAETCRIGGKRSVEDFGYGKGYVEALDQWRQIQELLDHIRARGMTSIIIGHAKTRTVSTPETEPYDSWVWDINDRAAQLLFRWADFIGFAGRQIYVSHGDKKDTAIDQGRYLYTQRTATHPCGGRGLYGRLPERIPLDFASFRAAYRAAEKADAEAKAALAAESAETAYDSTTTNNNKE